MLELINKKLKENYGSNLKGDPLFRVVFSDDQFEKRFGSFREFYGQLFVREVRELRQVKKYAYLPHKHILERWMPPFLAFDPEIPETSQGSYEPLYVFQDAKGAALPPKYEVCERVIYHLLHPRLPGHARSLAETEEQVQEQKEIQETLDILEDANPYLVGKLHGGEGIVRP